MKLRDLTQAEIEALSPEDYSNFLAYGDPDVEESPEDEEYYESHKQFDL